MKQYQKGEVMLLVMALMLAVVWLGRGHEGMMGHGGRHAAQIEITAPQAKTEESKESNEQQN